MYVCFTGQVITQISYDSACIPLKSECTVCILLNFTHWVIHSQVNNNIFAYNLMFGFTKKEFSALICCNSVLTSEQHRYNSIYIFKQSPPLPQSARTICNSTKKKKKKKEIKICAQYERQRRQAREKNKINRKNQGIKL